jgi:hypothetical protein
VKQSANTICRLAVILSLLVENYFLVAVWAVKVVVAFYSTETNETSLVVIVEV